MLSKDKTIIKARLVLAVKQDDYKTFRKWAEKIKVAYDKFEWVEGLMGPLDIIFKEIEPKENAGKFLTILSEELDEFYYNVFLYNYEFDKDINKSLKIVDDLIQSEDRKRVKHILNKNKLESLLKLEPAGFMEDRINEEIGEVLSELESF